jgi:hypothetical protein
VGTFPARSLSVTINRDWREVYDFTQPPEHFAQWASGLATALHFDGTNWAAESPLGPVRVRFTERNPYGILDHTVIFPDETEVYNPLRVVANGDGAEIIFTLFRRPEMTESDLARDAETVTRDLHALKTLLEA